MHSFLLMPKLAPWFLAFLPFYGSDEGGLLMFATLFNALILPVAPAPGCLVPTLYIISFVSS